MKRTQRNKPSHNFLLEVYLNSTHMTLKFILSITIQEKIKNICFDLLNIRNLKLSNPFRCNLDSEEFKILLIYKYIYHFLQGYG